MSYLHIDNLYKNQDILQFKECYAMEKIHGTSANISYNNKTLHFFSGGEKHERFIALFNREEIKAKIEQLGVEKIVIFGEAYGGSQQGMRDTYGDQLKFVAFEVKIGTNWLAVPQAEEIVKSLGLEFIHYKKIPATLYNIDTERDTNSVQAMRNGLGIGKKREGIVLRPLVEVTKNNGERIIAKHKTENFRETKTKRKVKDPNQLKVLEKAKEIAEEWVTLMRLNHVLDKVQEPSMQKMREIIQSMCEDVKREASEEIVWNKQVERSIGKKTALLTKQYFQNKLREVKR